MVRSQECTGKKEGQPGNPWRLGRDQAETGHTLGLQDTFVSVEGILNPSRPIKDFHFVLDGKSFQVLVKHFSNLLPKVSGEEGAGELLP